MRDYKVGFSLPLVQGPDSAEPSDGASQEGPSSRQRDRIYERLDGRPDDNSLAMQHWKAFDPRTDEDRRFLEILVDGALYFPDWKTFPTFRQKVWWLGRLIIHPKSLNNVASI